MAGNKAAAKTPMMAITVSSSTRVKPERRRGVIGKGRLRGKTFYGPPRCLEQPKPSVNG
jgi:hypothetical protein